MVAIKWLEECKTTKICGSCSFSFFHIGSKCWSIVFSLMNLKRTNQDSFSFSFWHQCSCTWCVCPLQCIHFSECNWIILSSDLTSEMLSNCSNLVSWIEKHTFSSWLLVLLSQIKQYFRDKVCNYKILTWRLNVVKRRESTLGEFEEKKRFPNSLCERHSFMLL